MIVRKKRLAAIVLKPDRLYMFTPWRTYRLIRGARRQESLFKAALTYPMLGQKALIGLHPDHLEDPMLLYQHLSRIKKTYHLWGMNATLVLPEEHFVLRTMEIPRSVEKYMTDYLQTEHKAESIVPLQQPLFTVHVLERSDEHFRVVIHAVEKSVLDHYLTVFEALNWHIKGFLHPGMALGAWLNEDDPEQGIIIFIQLHGVSFYVYEQRQLIFSRFFAWEPDLIIDDVKPMMRIEHIARITDYMMRIERFARTTLYAEGVILEKVYVLMEREGLEEAGTSISAELSRQLAAIDMDITTLSFNWPGSWPKPEAFGGNAPLLGADLYVASGALRVT